MSLVSNFVHNCCSEGVSCSKLKFCLPKSLLATINNGSRRLSLIKNISSDCALIKFLLLGCELIKLSLALRAVLIKFWTWSRSLNVASSKNCVNIGFSEELMRTHLTRSTHLFALWSMCYLPEWNIVNNNNKYTQNINGDINGMLTSPFSRFSSLSYW